MSKANINGFSTPVVREMTLEEYFEQRRRVVASLMTGKADEHAAEDRGMTLAS
jgi:hypothetical protein